ncbi:hypothetical protein N0R80_24515 (plasmid) [Sinorhizobium sp. C101]|nr:histidine kinase dimerization/phospho-acceptor domain-containing protein [Sinorhizobium sp. C101]WEJ38871.1 hypothetical protein N0R80_24515 [Sinorhizobium sp. C101]
MTTGNDFQHQAIAAHVAQRLAGPARAILGFQELLIEQARDLGLIHIKSDLDRIGAAARQLNGFIDRLLEGTACALEEGEAEAEARLRHDLRTPLNAIIGYSEMILEEAGDAPEHALKEDLHVILSAAAELLRQVDAIASLSRGETVEMLQPGERAEIDAAGLERLLFKAQEIAWPEQGAGSSSSTTWPAIVISCPGGCGAKVTAWSPPNPDCPRWRNWPRASSTSSCSTF